ncbi:Glutathione-dependent formaldehyde-activating enzyme [compost metagenome]
MKYAIDAPIESATHCHCSQCRKGHGAAFASYGTVPLSAFRLLEGGEALGRYISSPGVTRSFCKVCGSTLLWHTEHRRHANSVGVALGTLDSPLGEIAQKHIYTDSKADWYAINDGLPVEQRP